MPGPYDKMLDPNMMAGAGGAMMGKGPQGAFAPSEASMPPAHEQAGQIADYLGGRAGEYRSDSNADYLMSGLTGLNAGLMPEVAPLWLLASGLYGASGYFGGRRADKTEAGADNWVDKFPKPQGPARR